jgi:hypothetical protein
VRKASSRSRKTGASSDAVAASAQSSRNARFIGPSIRSRGFTRSAEAATEAARDFELCFGDNAPHSLIDLLTGHEQTD